jgi:hypothetical protein
MAPAATTRVCLVALVVALAFLFLLDGGVHAASSAAAQRRRQVRSLLRRLNKPAVATIEVCVCISLSLFIYKQGKQLADCACKLKLMRSSN